MNKEVTVIRGKMRQSFQEIEKRRIVAESYKSDLSLNKFAAKVGIAAPTLCLWRKQFKTDCTKESQENGNFLTINSQENANFPVVQDRLSELQTENQALKTELFNVKKAFGNKLISLEMERMSDG